MRREIDVYEDNAGRLYLHREGSGFVVCRGYPEELDGELNVNYPAKGLSRAQTDQSVFDDMCGDPTRASANGFGTITPEWLFDSEAIDHIATVDRAGVVKVLRTPGLSGRVYLGLDEID